MVDTDDPGWSEWVAVPEEAGGGEHLWVEDRMADLLHDDDGRTLFVSGCVRNQGRFDDHFDAVVLLSAPAAVIGERIAVRTTNDYGKAPSERALILEQIATIEPLLRASCTHELDASRRLGEVVDDLVRIAGGGGMRRLSPPSGVEAQPAHR